MQKRIFLIRYIELPVRYITLPHNGHDDINWNLDPTALSQHNVDSNPL